VDRGGFRGSLGAHSPMSTDGILWIGCCGRWYASWISFACKKWEFSLKGETLWMLGNTGLGSYRKMLSLDIPKRVPKTKVSYILSL